MPNNNTRTNANEFSSAPADDYVPVTPGAGDLPDGVCRGLLVTGAGTLDLTTPGGENRDGVPVAAGFNPLAARKVRGGTATGVWALY